MANRELELRKRALEAQFQADVEMLRAAYEVKMRALEMLFEAPEEQPRPALTVRPMRQLNETLAASETPDVSQPQAALPPAPAPEPAAPARYRGQVLDDLEDLLPELPEVFNAHDAVRALGYKPPRATLHRALKQLVADKLTVVADWGIGHAPIRYRKVAES